MHRHSTSGARQPEFVTLHSSLVTRHSSLPTRHSLLCIAALVACAAGAAGSEPIHWSVNGVWDDTGKPKGALLSDNDGWWGRSVYTGVTYDYEEAGRPNNPGDVFKGDREKFGRRLLDGNAPTGWHRPVGATGKRPIIAVFDFKRPCVFNEVDLVSSKTTNATAKVEASADGTNWTVFAEAECVGVLTRLRPETPGRGRHLRVTFLLRTTGTVYLDEVLVWGEGEVSDEYPESIRPIPRGDALRMACATNGVVEWVPLRDPTEMAREQVGQPLLDFEPFPPGGAEIPMARNETEVRYFAVANGTDKAIAAHLSAEGFGEGVRAELRIGGLVRVQPPKVKLTEQQLFDLKLTGEAPEGAFDGDRVGIVPFFAPDMVPPGNFARKYLANPEQVAGFPGRVEIAPGEAAAVMLRLTTDGAAPGVREGRLVAGGPADAPAASLPVAVRVIDATLPEEAGWIYAWGPFTRQFPFEGASRYENDVQPIRELGVNAVWDLPAKGTKPALLARGREGRMTYFARCIAPRLRKKIGTDAEIDDVDREDVRTLLAALRAEAEPLGVKPGQLALAIGDEPGVRAAPKFDEICHLLKELAPDMCVYVNPSFWTGSGFTPTDEIIDALGGFYTNCVDISVPFRSLTEDPKGREALWATPRRVSASYSHPAHRAGRSIAWANFRYGLDGFAFWAYYCPVGNPWDIRTWKYYAYECLLAFPLENGVALTPVYEEMREAWDDWRLLTALREAGKTELLDSLLKEFGDTFDQADIITAKPYKCDFLKLRKKALGAFPTIH